MTANGLPGTRDGYTVLVPSKVALVTAEPYLREALRRGRPVYLVAPVKVASLAFELLPNLDRDHVNPLLRLSPLDGLLRLVHTALAVLLTRRPFDTHQSALEDKRRAGGRWPSKALLATSMLTARLSPRRVNRLLSALLSPLQRNPYPTRLVLSVSYPALPHRLCASGQRVVTLMESWDHAVKKQVGHHSQIVVGWNADLAQDWRRHQGADQVVVGFPLKLRYAVEHASSGQPEGDLLMYAAGTSANTDRPGWYEDEQSVIDELCQATADTDWRLLIKPKPNGRSGDFDSFADKYQHVTVGAYRDAAGAVDYFLDDEYNAVRMEDLAPCAAVINCWTTFALDAALAGKPVLQLDLRGQADRWPAMARAMENYHLATYVLGDQPGVIRPPSNADIGFEFRKMLADPLVLASSFRNHICEWLKPDVSADAAVSRVLDTLDTLEPAAAPSCFGSILRVIAGWPRRLVRTAADAPDER